jgi:hypothetical protein
MEDSHFKMVVVEAPEPGKLSHVKSVAEALECLTTGWQGLRQGPACARAKMACLAALDGNLTGDEARSAFIDAAADADILVEKQIGLLAAVLK